MEPAILGRFVEGLVGRRCDIDKREHDWTFDFGDGCVVAVAAAWRLVNDEGVAFADREDVADRPVLRLLGGDSAPERLLRRRKVRRAELTPVTGDLTIVFDNGLKLEVFNNSAHYEGWQAYFALDGESVCLVGLAGGGVSAVGAARAGLAIGTLVDP